MRDLRWLFEAAPQPRPPQPFVDMLNSLPGVRAKVGSNQLHIEATASFDCGQLVESFFINQNIPYRIHQRPSPLPVVDVTTLPDLRPETKVAQHQIEGLAFAQQRGGGMLQWPCGSGKTLAAILFALVYRQKTVVITRGSATYQWVGQIKRFTTLDTDNEVMVLDSFSRYDVRPSPELPLLRKVYPTSNEAPEEALTRVGLRKTPSMVEALSWVQQHAGALWQRVPAPRRPQAQRLAEAGLILIREEQDPDAVLVWQPWCVYDRTNERVHSYIDVDASPLFMADTEIQQQVNVAQNTDNSRAMRRAAYVLVQRARGYSTPEIAAGIVEHYRNFWPDGDGQPTTKETLPDVVATLAQRLGQTKVDALHTTLDVPDSVWLVIVGWPVLSTWVDALKSWKPATIIEDESHNAKNPKHWDPIPQPDGGKPKYRRKATQAAAMADLAQTKSVQRVLETTWTPADNAVKDWWAQVNHLDPYCFYKFHLWSVRYCNGHPGEYGWIDDGSSNEDELRNRLSTFVHSVSNEAALGHLPPLLLSITHLPVEKQDRVRHDNKEAKAAARLGASALLQWQLDQAAFATTSHALKAIQEGLKEGEKIVVLTGRTTHAEHLHKQVLGFVDTSTAFVGLGTGADDPRERADLVEGLLASTGGGVLIGTTLAWKESIDGLQHANRAILLSLPWTLAIEQVLGRFRRLGGLHSVSVEILIPEGTIAERVLQQLEAKILAIASVTPGEGPQHLANLLDEGREATITAKLDSLAAKLLGNDDDEEGWLDDGTDD